MTRLDAIATNTDQYCTQCYEVVRLGESPSHRDEVHDGDAMVDIIPIQETTDGEYIAKDSGMGHFSPHVWIDVDDHETCGECGAVKVKPEDVPDELVDERGAVDVE